MPRWLIVTLIVLGCCAMALMVGLVAAVVVNNRQADSVSRIQRMDRDEFKSAVWLEGPNHILEKVGRPDRTRTTHNHNEIWYYSNRVRDPISGRLGSASIQIDGGIICSRVDFD